MVRELENKNPNLLIQQAPNSINENPLVVIHNQEGNKQIYFNLTIMQDKGLNQAEIFQSFTTPTRQYTNLSPTSPSNSPSPDVANLPILLSNGGVAVAVIIAMACFSKIQMKSVSELLKAINQNKK
ncbi:hypothetical protein [Nostoc sp. FACHB-280]|uniref:hypothetical protein n=1 Tax=Nostoc sp. FACHB-280 TaxID=2692839 RepID=UPI00168ADFE6|nr:hypothetical protein [Nostoc sp. FACHB-280]MBD2496204.1 hypothetical protein [Nostoc sp. FACHB-280]